MINTMMNVGGVAYQAKGLQTFERISPATGEPVSKAPAASIADIDHTIESAKKGFATWSQLPPSERRLRLMRAADALEAHIPQIVELGVAEIGATPDWIGFNAQFAANILREAAALATQVKGEVIASDLPDKILMSVRKPCGVVFAVAPWNSPIILAVRAVAVPLACGNSVILKASEVCPVTHCLVAKVLIDAGIDGGALNVITHAPEDAPSIVEHIIASPAVRRINFTGSTHVGRIVGKLAAEHFKPVLLELGGKAPLLVLDDADVDAAVAAIQFGAFFNQGQICLSTERVLVHDSLADELIDKLTQKVSKIKAAMPGEAPLGLLDCAASAKRVAALLEDAKAKGANLPLPIVFNGACMQPAIVVDVTPEMAIYTQESFGPVVTIERVTSTEEAIRLANQSEYGLTSSVFTKDVGKGLDVASQLDAGTCHINGATIYDEAQTPMGGVKSSGYGRFGGVGSIQEFTDVQTVSIQKGTPFYPL